MIFPVVEGCYDMFPYTPHLECLGIFQRLEHPNSLGTPSVGTSKTQVGMTGMTDGKGGEIVQRPYPARDVKLCIFANLHFYPKKNQGNVGNQW